MKPQRDPSYFFDKGLKFKCQQCGDCCCGAPGTIYVTADEIKTIAAFINMPVEKFVSEMLYPFEDSYSIREHADGRCFFFDPSTPPRARNGCSIYSVRPLQCSSFPFWMSHLRNESRWKTLSKQCPGIGEGDVISKEEILKRMTKF